MTDPGVTAIRIVRGATIFHVHGEFAGAEGVWLAKDQVDGIYDAPVTTTWKTGAFQDGSRQRARKWEHRDMKLGFHIKETASSYEFNDSQFRRMFDYEADPWETTPTPTTIEVVTTLSGTRKLDVLMSEQPEFGPALDPQMQQYGNTILKLRAGKPFWYEAAATASGWLESSYTNTTTTGSGAVTVTNPTDQIMRQKWILTRGTWTLPDFSWAGARGARAPGGAFPTRTITGITVTTANVGAVVDLDRQELMFRDAADTNILGQSSGKIFAFPIPPYTPPTTLPVSYSAAPAGGAMVRLVQPRYWSRPWGLEGP